jgi:hypothetical protein
VGGLFGAGVGAASGTLAGAKKVSPERLDHIQKNLMGGVGTQITSAINPLLADKAKAPSVGTGSTAFKDIPVAGPILGKFTGSDMDQEMHTLESQFYDSYDKTTMEYRTFKWLEANKPDEAGNYMLAHTESIKQGHLVTNIGKRLGQLDTTIKDIIDNPNMTPADKRDVLKNKYEDKKRVLKGYDGVINQTGRSIGYNKTVDTTTR